MMTTLRAVLLAATAIATAAPAAGAVEDYIWRNRVLVLFAPGDDSRIAVQRDELLADRAALADRDMVAFAVIGSDRIEAIYGPSPPASEARRIREALDIGADTAFTALLIGKDGGVKWREDRPAGRAELFGLIDAMPMRRAGR